MNSIQTFLLEVIVERMDIREKTRDRQKVGFNKGISSSGSEWIVTPNNSKLSARNQSAPEPVNSGPLPCSVTIAFSDLDPIVINEDSSNLWDAEFKSKGEDPKEGKLEEAQAEKELEDKKQARAAGLSPKEYQDSKKKNPNLTEKRFTRGKSTLIRMQPSEMIELLKTEKLFVHVEGGKTIPWTLGDAVVEFPANFVDAVVVAAYSSAMREMISREGHIWWPKELYRTVMLKEVRKAQKELERRKALELTQEEKDLPVRFKNLCELDPLPHPCPICEQEGDECHWKPLTYKDIAPPKPPKKKKNTKIDKKGQAWLMYPSPEPITPPPLPTTAQMTEIADVVNQSKKPTAIVSLFVSNLKPKDDEPEEQLYLLEVIVDSLEVFKEGILETFQEKPAEPVPGEATQSEETVKPKQGPVRVLVKFFDFPTIEIQEREFKENEERKDPETKEEEVKDPSGATVKDPEPTEQTAIKENDPIYKNKKAEEARWKSEGKKGSHTAAATEFPGAIPPANKFTSGKSCLFPMVPKEMMDVIRKHPIEVQVHRDAADGEPAHLIGKARLNLGQEFIDAIALANTPTVLPVSAFIEDEFDVTNVFGDVTGTLSLLIRLSCFGATIFTQFKYIQGEKGFKFSTSEGVMKSKGEMVPKKEETKPEPVKLDERMPYFTEDENLGMYLTTPHLDDKFKVPVPWRKLHDDPITPQVCGPKRLFKEQAAQKMKRDCPLYDFDQMFPSVGQTSYNTSAGRSLYPGQPVVSGNIFEGAYCRGQEIPSTVHAPPEFGSSMPEEIKRLLPGQRGTGRGALDIPPGTKFACQFGADWVTEADPCSCSNKRRVDRGGACCMAQAQMIPCPKIPGGRSGMPNFGAGQNWGSEPPTYVCSNTQIMDKPREYPPLEQAPPHLQSAFTLPSQVPSGSKVGNQGSQQVGGIYKPDVRYVPCPNSPDIRSGGNVVCGLEALADPNQRNLQNLLQPTLMAPKCPPDSSRNMPSLCTCPKVPTVVPPPVPAGVLRCECSNILTALKPIDMPYTCQQPEPQPTMQPGASSSCPPCPPVPINLPPRAPECPLAKLLKDAQNESKPDSAKKHATKQDPSVVSSEPPQHGAMAAKQDPESPERTGVHSENQKSATFVAADSAPKSGTTTDEPVSEVKSKKTSVKEKANKILQEEVAAATVAQVSYPTEATQRELEEKTSKTTSLSSEVVPTKKKKTRQAAGRSKENHNVPPSSESRDKDLNIAYTPTAGIYPGMVIGHKNCVPIVRLVPKRMGWLWNIKDADGFMKPGRGWRPGSIQTNVMKVMDNVKTNTNKQNKEKRAVKSTRSDPHPRKAESGKLLATGAGDAPMYLPIDLTPTLHLHKKHGQYYVSMVPPKERRHGQRPKKKKMNAKGDMVEESESDDSRPAQFRIDPKNPDGLDLNRELYETETSSSNTEDSYQMELVAPSSLRNRQPQAIKVDMEIQCTEDDFAPIESKHHADKAKKSIVSRKSVVSQKSKKAKGKSAKTSKVK